MAQLSGGDMCGLRQIYEEYGRMIYSSVLQLCRNQHMAEDITSEFFLKLRKAAAVYREGYGHKKWLLVSARNLAIDFMRRNSREIPSDSDGGENENYQFSEIPDRSDTETEVSSRLTAAELLDSLDVNLREIVHLKVYCGFTFAEIAAILKQPQGTVAWRYQSAIKKLKAMYGEVR